MQPNFVQNLHRFLSKVDPSFLQKSIMNVEIAVEEIQELTLTASEKVLPHIDELLQISEMVLKFQPSFQAWKCYSSSSKILMKNKRVVEESPIRIQKLLYGMICLIANGVTEVDQKWLKDLHNENDEESIEDQILDECLDSLQELSEKLNANFVRKSVHKLINHSFSPMENLTWRQIYGILNVFFALIENVNEITEIDFIMEFIMKCFQHSHPKIRYTIGQLIKEYSLSLKKKFKLKYIDNIFNVLGTYLNDKTRRIIANTFDSLATVCEQFNEMWQFGTYLQTLKTVAVNEFNRADSELKPYPLQLMSGLITIKPPVYPNIVEFLQLLNNSITIALNQVPKNEFLIDNCFQCMSLLLSNSVKEQGNKYVDGFVKLLLSNKDNISKKYFVNSWGHLCSSFEQFCNLGQVLPYLFQCIIDGYESQQHLIEFQLLQREESIQYVQYTIRAFKASYVNFIDLTFNFVKLILEKQNVKLDSKGEARQHCYNIFKVMLKQVQLSYPQYQSLTKNIIQYIFQQLPKSLAINQVNDFETVEELIQLLNSILEKVGSEAFIDFLFLLGYIQTLFLSIEDTYKKIEENQRQQNEKTSQYNVTALPKLANTLYQTQEEDDDSQYQDISDLIFTGEFESLKENLVRGIIGISQIYQTFIVKSKPQIKANLIAKLIAEGFGAISKGSMINLKYGLDILGTLVEFANYNQISMYWSNIYAVFEQHVLSQHIKVRTGVIYSYGVLFIKIPSNMVSAAVIQSWLTLIHQSQQYSSQCHNKQDQGEFEFYRDNVYGALGKLIKTFHGEYPDLINASVFRRWFQNLPTIKNQQKSSQIEFMMELLYNRPEIIIKNADDVRIVLKTLAGYLLDEEIEQGSKLEPQIKECLFFMYKWDVCVQNNQFLWKNLTEEEQKAISRVTTEC